MSQFYFPLTSKSSKCWLNWMWTLSDVMPGLEFLQSPVQRCAAAKSIHGGTSSDHYATAWTALVRRRMFAAGGSPYRVVLQEEPWPSPLSSVGQIWSWWRHSRGEIRRWMPTDSDLQVSSMKTFSQVWVKRKLTLRLSDQRRTCDYMISMVQGYRWNQ